MSCPNKNTKDWKMLVQHLNSEFEAHRVFIAHGDTLPTVIGITDLKKRVGLTKKDYSVEQQIGINRKVRRWNDINGTSHFVQYMRLGESERFMGILKLNYLPVNKEAQADRDRRRKMEGYTKLQDIKDFETTFTPSESEQQAGQFVDGDFLPPSYFPAAEKRRKGPKFQPYIEVKEAELIRLKNKKAQVISRKKKATSGAEKRLVERTLQELNEEIEKIENDIKVLGNKHLLGQIETYAEEDMKTLEAIFKQPPNPDNIDIAKRLISIWQRGGDFSGREPQIFYDPDEFTERDDALEEVTRNFLEWKRRADIYSVKLIKYQDDFLKQSIRETKGFGDVTEEEMDFDKPIKDVNFLVKNLLDISENEHIALQAAAKWLKDANFGAREDLRDAHKKLDDLIKATGLTDYSIFQQTVSNTDDRLTGDMVNKYSQSYFDWYYNVSRKRDGVLKAASNVENTSKRNRMVTDANKKFAEEIQKNTVVFDPNILFWDETYSSSSAPTDKQKANHEAKLRDLLGDTEYEKQYNIAKEKIEEFKIHMEEFTLMLQANTEDEQLQGYHMEMIQGQMDRVSPYVFGDLMNEKIGYDGVTAQGKVPGASTQYTQILPKKELGYYDDKFKQIEGNQDLLNLYNFMDDMLQEMKSYLPSQKVQFMRPNSIPTIKKNTYDAMTGKDSAYGFGKTLRERIRESVLTTDVPEEGTQEERKNLQVQMLTNNNQRINDYVDLKDTEYRATNNGEAPSTEERSEWRKQIMDTIAKEKTFDLGRVMKAFSAMAVTYRHKSAIEPQMRVITDIVERQHEARLNHAGDTKKDKYKNILTKKEGLENTRDMLENFMDVAFWGFASNLPEGRMGKKKVLTVVEKDLMKTLVKSQEELDQLLKDENITQAEYDNRSKVVKEQMEVLGGTRTASKYGDILLKYVHYKGMGYNVYAAFTNIGFGLISNIIEGSDGRNYSMKSYRIAQSMVFNSVLKNATFNLVETGKAKKIRSLMNRLDVLKESRNELYKTTGQALFKKVKGKLEWLDPLSPQSRSEYFNQAPIMIAMLMDTKVTNKKGEKVSIWSLFDEDGNLKEGAHASLSRTQLVDVKGRIDKVVKMNHGNYDPDTPIAAKRKFIGRAASQFRTWAFQGFAERWRTEFKDNNLTNMMTGEEYVLRKGRYRTYGSYFQHDEYGGLRMPVHMVTQLLRKLVGRKTTFDSMINDQFTEADAANMRKNLTEIVIALALMALALVLKSVDDDDDDPVKKVARNLLLNQIGRVTTDIYFYSNPMEFETLSRNALPIFGALGDAKNLWMSSAEFLTGEDTRLQSGPNKGTVRAWRDLQKMVPGLTQIKRIQSAADQEYKDESLIQKIFTKDDEKK